MVRATTKGSRSFGPKTAASFLLGLALGLALVAPVIPPALETELVGLLSGTGFVVVVSALVLGVLMAALAFLYQTYLVN